MYQNLQDNKDSKVKQDNSASPNSQNKSILKKDSSQILQESINQTQQNDQEIVAKDQERDRMVESSQNKSQNKGVSFNQDVTERQKEKNKNQSQMLMSGYQEMKQSYRQTFIRWVVLFFICYYYMTGFFMGQLPAVLMNQLIDELNMSAFQFNLANGMQCLPNVFTPLLVPYIVIKIGINGTIMFYSVSMVIGILVQYLATVEHSFILYVIGQILYGFGNNGSIVILNSFTCMWFKDDELSTALSTANAFQFFGYCVCSLMIPPIYAVTSLQEAYFVALLIMCSNTISAFFLIMYEKIAKSHDDEHGIINSQIDGDNVDKFEMADILKFDKLFWLVNLSTMLGYGCLQYSNNLQLMLIKDYNVTTIEAGYWLAAQYLIQMPITPAVGYFTDKRGKRSQALTIGSIINVGQFILFALAPVCPDGSCSKLNYAVPILVGGVGNAFFGAVNAPMVALSVNPKQLNTAFGLYDCLMQLGYGVTPFIMGAVLNATKTSKYGFQNFYYLCILLAVLQLLSALWIWYFDATHKNKFDLKQRILTYISIAMPRVKRSQFLNQQDQRQVTFAGNLGTIHEEQYEDGK